jgi:hypothetical protein
MSTTLSLALLDRVQIASPCSARWEDMRGDDTTRRCEQCSLNVHNISSMTRAAAEAFLTEKLATGGRVCGLIYRRADGTILTADCPTGLAALRAKARRSASRVAATIGLTSLVTWAAAHESAGLRFGRTQPLATIAHHLKGDLPPPVPVTSMAMGDICVPPPVAAQPIQKAPGANR